MDPRRLVAGVVGGLAGGVVFGAMMHVMGMLPMVAALVGQDSVAVGWVVHLGISAAFGLGYGAVLGPATTSWGRAVGFGALYGVVWWVLGALIIMPARLGMPTLQVGEMQLQSLVGHLMYGVILGLTVHGLAQTAEDDPVTSRA